MISTGAFSRVQLALPRLKLENKKVFDTLHKPLFSAVYQLDLVFKLECVCLFDALAQPGAQAGIVAWSDGQQPLADSGQCAQTQIDVVERVVDRVETEGDQVGAVGMFAVAPSVEPL